MTACGERKTGGRETKTGDTGTIKKCVCVYVYVHTHIN